MSSPLDGVLVADFSRVLAGPLATMNLADLGATVVKVERPGSGDDTRQWGPPWATRTSSYFECLNRSKYGITLELTDPDQLLIAQELTRRADVVVENFRSGTLSRYGLDYDAVATRNPGIVYCSISGFGSAAGANRPGYDFVVQAVGGLMSITGEAEGEPMKVGVALVDVLTSKDAVIAILAALAARENSGVGDHVEVNLLSSLMSGLVNQAASYLTTGTSPTRMGNQHPSIAPYETLRCAEKLIAVTCGNNDQFRRLTETVGRPDLADNPQFADNSDRVRHRDQLIVELENALGAETAPVWEQRLTAANIPAGVVGDIGSAFALAAQLGLDPLVSPGPDEVQQVRNPVRFTRSNVAPPTKAPTLGEHSALIRSWLEGPFTRLNHPTRN
jgi:crotonobetainyl-CoA:carnitine CoA-transferase CaiB-like acyl-CoA transferase